MTGFDERVIAGMSHLANGDIESAKQLAAEIGALPPEESSPLSRAKFFEFVGNLALKARQTDMPAGWRTA